jgi:hypothetical protein
LGVADIVELGKLLLKVFDDVRPLFYMEHGVAVRHFTYYCKVFVKLRERLAFSFRRFADFCICFVGVKRIEGRSLITNDEEVMVHAMVNISLVWISKAI